jgi:hypothetical protein
VPGHIRERGRALLGAVLPGPVEQRLVHTDRLDRADPLGIVDQQPTVGSIVSLTVCPSPPNVANGSQTPSDQSIYAHRHHMRAAAGAVRPSAAPM